MSDEDIDTEIRLDKWLWSARFFKTRSLAAEAVSGGKIAVNGDRAKPSRIVRTGDKLTIRRGPYACAVPLLKRGSFTKKPTRARANEKLPSRN